MTRFHIKEDSESVVAGAESFREMQKLVEDKKKETKDSAIITVLTFYQYGHSSAFFDGVSCANCFF